MDSCSLLQGIFSTQRSNPGLPHSALQADSLPSEPPGKPNSILECANFFGNPGTKTNPVKAIQAGLPRVPQRACSYCSTAKSCLTLCNRLCCPSLSPGVCSNSCPFSWWCYLTISSSAVPFSFGLPSFSASRSFPMSRLFESGGQSIGSSASASVLQMNIHGWFSLGLTALMQLNQERTGGEGTWHPPRGKSLLGMESNTGRWQVLKIHCVSAWEMIWKKHTEENSRGPFMPHVKESGSYCLENENPVTKVTSLNVPFISEG